MLPETEASCCLERGTGFAVLQHGWIDKKGIKMKPRILIVDDDAAITQQLFWTLCDDYEVMTASDLHSALRRAMVYEPSVAILDLHLPPALDSPEVGLRILSYIKGRYPETKVLVMSSEADALMQQSCFAGGADGFLTKPFETEQLLATIHRIAPLALTGNFI
jgi:DNA-binding NtrC family response regulator